MSLDLSVFIYNMGSVYLSAFISQPSLHRKPSAQCSAGLARYGIASAVRSLSHMAPTSPPQSQEIEAGVRMALTPLSSSLTYLNAGP